MAVTDLTVPEECINLAGDCIPVEFTTDGLQESAYVSWQLEIYDTDIADAVAGSVLIVAGQKFTFAASADNDNNIIGISIAGIEAGFAANSFIDNNFDHGTSGSLNSKSVPKATMIPVLL